MSEKIVSGNLESVVKRNKEIRADIAQKVLTFKTTCNIMQVTSAPQLAFQLLKTHGLIQLPLDNQYLSGAIFVMGDKRIPVINTSQVRANQYFTAWHEIYHLYFDEVSFNHIIGTDTIMEERKADYFASCMLLGNLLPYFSELPEMDFLSKVFQCMDTFQAPYKAVLITLYESAYHNGNHPVMDAVIQNFDCQFFDLDVRFRELGLDDNLVKPTNIVNTGLLKSKIQTAVKNEPDADYHKENSAFLNNIIKEIVLITGDQND